MDVTKEEKNNWRNESWKQFCE